MRPNKCAEWGSVDRDHKLSDFCIFYGKLPFFNIRFTGFGGNATTFPKYHFPESYDFFFIRRLPSTSSYLLNHRVSHSAQECRLNQNPSFQGTGHTRRSRTNTVYFTFTVAHGADHRHRESSSRLLLTQPYLSTQRRKCFEKFLPQKTLLRYCNSQALHLSFSSFRHSHSFPSHTRPLSLACRLRLTEPHLSGSLFPLSHKPKASSVFASSDSSG